MPRHYSYLRPGKRDKRSYTGDTNDVRKRALALNEGRVRSGATPAPLEPLGDEGWLHRDEALPREGFLETAKGGQFLRNRLAGFLDGIGQNKLERY